MKLEHEIKVIINEKIIWQLS